MTTVIEKIRAKRKKRNALGPKGKPPRVRNKTAQPVELPADYIPPAMGYDEYKRWRERR